MTALSDVRAELAGLVGTDTCPVLPYLPGSVAQVPSGYVIPGASYLAPDETFGSFVVNLEVILVFGSADNASSTKQIDDLIEDAIVGVVNGGWGVDGVTEPFQIEPNNKQYLAVAIQVNRAIRL